MRDILYFCSGIGESVKFEFFLVENFKYSENRSFRFETRINRGVLRWRIEKNIDHKIIISTTAS